MSERREQPSLSVFPPLEGVPANGSGCPDGPPSTGQVSPRPAANDDRAGTAGDLPWDLCVETDPERLWQSEWSHDVRRTLPDQRPWFVSARPSDPTRLAWLDTFAAVAGDDDLRIAPLADGVVARLLHAFGYSDDLDRLRRSAEGHGSARAWLRSAQVATTLSPAGRLFADLHAPAIWRRLVPDRVCLEGLHVDILHDLEDPGRRPLPEQLGVATALDRLLPATVTTTREADLWLGPTSALASWIELVGAAPIEFGTADDRDDHLAALGAVRRFVRRFCDERADRQRSWRLLRAQLRWRLGEVEQARAELQAEIRAAPQRAEADCAWATVVGGRGFGEPPTVRGIRAALAVLAQAGRRRLTPAARREVQLLEAEYRDHLDYLVPERVPAGCPRGTRLLRLLDPEAAALADAGLRAAS